MIGVVVVSHSRQLAEAAVELASEMMSAAQRPVVRVAAGLADGSTGTDATAVSAAIEEADSGAGVLVLVDLGSALLSAELACELVDPDLAARVRISSAPFVEGLVTALVTASSGAGLERVAEEAERALVAKRAQLGQEDEGAATVGTGGPVVAAGASGLPDAQGSLVLPNAHGLHARPAAAFVQLVNRHDATLEVTNATRGIGPVDGSSLTAISGLAARQGDRLQLNTFGPQASELVAALTASAADDFGAGSPAPPAAVTPPSNRPEIHGRLTRLVIDPGSPADEPADDRDSDPAAQLQAFDEAVHAVRAELASMVERARSVVGEAAADMVDVQRVLLDDPAIATAVRRRIEAGTPPVQAWNEQLAQARAPLERLADPYLRARAQDLSSLERRMRAWLLGARLPDPASLSGVVLVDELDAVTAVLLDPAVVAGVITRSGGELGHGVLIARERGLPVWVDVGSELDDVPDGVELHYPQGAGSSRQ